MRKFHCCASCVHFRIERDQVHKKINTRCSRLKYETKPHFQFSCWEPKSQVKKLMEKEEGQDGI